MKVEFENISITHLRWNLLSFIRETDYKQIFLMGRRKTRYKFHVEHLD